jgi:hypothetical protein
MSRQTISTKKIITWQFLTRFIISLITLYLGIAIGFATLSPYNYTRRNQNFLLSGATVLLQPAMEVLADGKVTHFYDYKSLTLTEVPNLDLARVISSKEQFRDFSGSFQSHFINALASIGAVSEAAIIEPVNFTGQWSLAYCQTVPNSSVPVCQISKIKHSGQVKILVDGGSLIWGQTESGEWIQLRLVEYINRSERRDLLLI